MRLFNVSQILSAKKRLLLVSILSALVLVLTGLFFYTVNAQSKEGQITVGNSAGNPNCGTPVCAKILSSSFDEQRRDVVAEFDFWNNSNSFADDLEYTLEFYTGEEFPESGYVFSQLQYVTSVTKEVEALHPDEKTRVRLRYNVPQMFEGGNYYLRLTVSNPTKSFFGITFSKEPLKLTGLGGFLPFIQAMFVNPDKETLHGLMEGPILKSSSTALVVIPKDKNIELFSHLETEEIFFEYDIYDISDPETILNKKDKSPLGLEMNLKKDNIGIKFAPWEGITAGSHEALVSFSNFKGEQVVEDMRVRLLYEGFMTRVHEVKTGINSYRRGESIDIVANIIASGNAVPNNIFLKTTLFGTKGQTQEINKKIELETSKNNQYISNDLFVSLDDFFAEKRMVVNKIEFEIRNEEGELLNFKNINIETEEIYAYPSGNSLLKNTVIFIFIVLILIVIGILVRNKGKKIAISIVIAANIVGYSYLYTNDVSADAKLGPDDIQVYWVNGQCPKNPDNGGGGDNSDDSDDGGDGGDDDDDDGSDNCKKPRLNGALLQIWSDPSNEPSGFINDDECTVFCQDVTYYVKLQCKDCGNSGLDVAVDFFKDYHTGSEEPSSSYTVDTNLGFGGESASPYLSDFGFYAVERDKTLEEISNERKLASVDLNNLGRPEEGSYSGTSVNANDIINWWIYGPFVDTVCTHDSDIYLNEFPTAVSQDGTVTHKYNIRATTQFGGEACSLAFGGEDEGYETESHSASLNDPRQINTNLCANLEATFFLDEDEDGMHDSGESFVKNSGAPASCSGVTMDVIGEITGLDEDDVNFTNLDSSQCYDDFRPYFEKQEIYGGKYDISVDDEYSIPGWLKTGLLLDNATFTTDAIPTSSINVIIGTTGTPAITSSTDPITYKALVGIKNLWPVSFSCVPDPQMLTAVPVDVDFNITNYYSDEYNIEDLTFIWSGETGLATELEIDGGTNNGALLTTYTAETGGLKDYTTSVYAEDSDGDRVSADLECVAPRCVCPSGFTCVNGQCELDLTVSCAAYDHAAATGTPRLFFGPEEDVYWKANVSGGDDPYDYTWTGAASGDQEIVGPYSVGSGEDYSYEDGPVYVTNANVIDDDATNVDAICSINIRECLNNNDCPLPQEICRTDDFTCGPPKPSISQPLGVSPNLVNEGQACDMHWEIAGAWTCDLYKDAEINPTSVPTSTAYYTDLQEIVAGSNPFDSDDDPFNTDLDSDFDGDGIKDRKDLNDDNDAYTDFSEVVAGTNPWDPNDYPGNTDPDSDFDGDGITDVADDNDDSEGYLVFPGSYRLHCENILGEAIDVGPGRCVFNPEIKEL